MNTELKRRAFLSSIIAALIAGPFAIRHFKGFGNKITYKDFGQEFKKYQASVEIPIHTIDGPEQVSFDFVPSCGQKFKYIIFSPSTMRGELAKVLGRGIADEPDAFFVREGLLGVHRTDRNQTVINGGDTVSKFRMPLSEEEHENNQVLLLCENSVLYPARQTGTNSTRFEKHFLNLLSLRGLLTKRFSVGSTWKSMTGRVKPFNGYETDYEIAGYSEIVGRKAVNVKFSARIKDVAQLPGFSAPDSQKNESIQNSHFGNAWFDLETGMLVRQETTMRTEAENFADLNKPIVVETNCITQLWNA
ncbi:MAG: hypothetical protein ACRC2T_03140 [Thermoguttaceae bacterium]